MKLVPAGRRCGLQLAASDRSPAAPATVAGNGFNATKSKMAAGLRLAAACCAGRGRQLARRRDNDVDSVYGLAARPRPRGLRRAKRTAAAADWGIRPQCASS